MKLFIASLIFVSCCACSESPLLNHANASDQRRQTTPPAATEESETTPNEPVSCEIRLSQAALCLRLEWLKGPSTGEENRLIVRASNLQGESVDLIALNVELWMPTMGHGSAPTALYRPLSADGQVQNGVYGVRNIHFIMPGKWEIRFRVTTTVGVDVAQVPLSL